MSLLGQSIPGTNIGAKMRQAMGGSPGEGIPPIPTPGPSPMPPPSGAVSPPASQPSPLPEGEQLPPEKAQDIINIVTEAKELAYFEAVRDYYDAKESEAPNPEDYGMPAGEESVQPTPETEAPREDDRDPRRVQGAKNVIRDTSIPDDDPVKLEALELLEQIEKEQGG